MTHINHFWYHNKNYFGDLLVDTICIHGDGEHAIEYAVRFYNDLKENNIEIKY